MAISLALSKNSVAATEWVQHTYKILYAISQAKSNTIEIELDTQTYRITGDEKRLANRNQIIQSRAKTIEFLQKETQDNPNQQTRLLQIRDVMAQRLAIADQMVSIRRTQGADAAAAFIATKPLQETRVRVYKLFNDMESEERALLNQRLAERERSRKASDTAVMAAGILLLSLLIFIYFLIKRQFEQIELSRQKTAESESKLLTTLYSIGDAVLTTDTASKITSMNKIAEYLTGWEIIDAQGQLIQDVLHITNKTLGYSANTLVENAINTREIQYLEKDTLLIGRNGNQIPIADSAAPIIDSDGNLSGVVIVFRDISKEMEAERIIREQNIILEKRVLEQTHELYTSESKLRSITDNVPALIAYVDANQRYLYSNQKYRETFAPNQSSIEGMTTREVLGEERYAIVQPDIIKALKGIACSYDWQPFTNVWHMVSYLPTIEPTGETSGYYVLISDITDRKLSELELYKLTHYDGLTGLPNSTQFTDSLHEAIEIGNTSNQGFSLIQINIEKLSEINDALGFSKGDQVLQEVAERLKHAAAQPYEIARLRGDEFAILLKNCRANETLTFIDNIEKLFTLPLYIADIPLNISVRIGLVTFPEGGSTPHDLYRHVDFAVRQAKKRNVYFTAYDRTLDSDKPHRLALAAELRRAIDENNLALFLQPKVNCVTGEVCGVEALLRWNHLERGLINPIEFIPLAEQIGLIKPLTQWVLVSTIELLNTWQSAGTMLPIAINLSARNLHENDLVERVHLLMKTWSIRPNSLEIEVTESSVMEDAKLALEVLHLFRDEGIPLAIDDFGTGYSSLAYLQRLPVQFIKIDKSFVSEMLANNESLMIVRSTIDLAHDLGKEVIAEGVETKEHWDKLHELGCDIAQGYFIAKPMPAAEFLTWLKNYKAISPD
ncbi:MAG TPA: EAL domain-containing protein [Methylophilaceae bacterium]|jgi:diguanylate cyclase (GGDEF)-like protein/PAS domain S-box-containing protein